MVDSAQASSWPWTGRRCPRNVLEAHRTHAVVMACVVTREAAVVMQALQDLHATRALTVIGARINACSVLEEQ